MLLISVEVSVKVACLVQDIPQTCEGLVGPQSYLHATYAGGSICECGLSVHSVTDCSHRAITMQLTVVEVLVKVACQSTTVTD